jgi:uncharacterized protein with PQ loop repeat
MGKKYDILGYIASILGIISFVTLVIHNHYEQDTDSLSPYWLIFGIIIQILWFTYGYINKVYPLLLAPPIILSGYLYLSYLKIKLETNIISNYFK